MRRARRVPSSRPNHSAPAPPDPLRSASRGGRVRSSDHVVADVGLMDYALRILDQRFDTAFCTDRADHLQTVEREGFQRLARTVLVGVRAGRILRGGL